MAAFTAIPVGIGVLENAIIASLAPALPLVGGFTVVGIATFKAVAWWKASTAAAAARTAAAAHAAAEVAARAAAVAAAEALAAAQVLVEKVVKTAAEKVVEVAAETAVERAPEAATFVSIPVTVAAVAAIVVIGGGYYMYTQYKKHDTRTDAPPQSSQDANRCNDGDRRPPRGPSDTGAIILISKSTMTDLLKKHGKEIWKKLVALIEGKKGTIWKNKDFRVDAGPMKRKSTLKVWHLQVNREAESVVAKKLKNQGTHQILFKDTIDLGSAPDYETWVGSILNKF